MVKTDNLKNTNLDLYQERERTPKKIFSSHIETPTLSPSTSFSSLDSGFIHGDTNTPPQDCLSPDGLDVCAPNPRDQVLPGTSTPVLTRVSILRTSSQRSKLWSSSSPRQQAEQKDSVRFRLSLPVEFSDSDSDSQTGSYSINNIGEVNKPKRRRGRQSITEKEWEPVLVKSLKDDKQSVRHKIKAGYVSQIKQIFSASDPVKTDDNDINSRKSTLRRHKSVNDVTKSYLSAAQTKSSLPERTHSLLNLSDRPALSSLRLSYDAHGEPIYTTEKGRRLRTTSQEFPQTDLLQHENVVPKKTDNAKTVEIEEKTTFTREGSTSCPISRTQAGRRPVHRHKTDPKSKLNTNEIKSNVKEGTNATTSQQELDGNFVRSKSLRTVHSEGTKIPFLRTGSVRSQNVTSTENTEKISFLRTGSLRASDALKNFLKNQYPSDENQDENRTEPITGENPSPPQTQHVQVSTKTVNQSRIVNKGIIHEHDNPQINHSMGVSDTGSSSLNKKQRSLIPKPKQKWSNSVTNDDHKQTPKENKSETTKKLTMSVSEKISLAIENRNGNDNHQKFGKSTIAEHSILGEENTFRKKETLAFQRTGSERLPKSQHATKPDVEKDAKFQRVGSERFTSHNRPVEEPPSTKTRLKSSSDALKSFLHNRYPPNDNTSPTGNTKTVNNAKSEVNELILKFGLKNRTENDWDDVSRSTSYNHNGSNTSSASNRQIDPNLVQCLTPPVSPDTDIPEPVITSEQTNSSPQELDSCYFSDNTLSELSPRDNGSSSPNDNVSSVNKQDMFVKPHVFSNVSEIIVMGKNERGIDVIACGQSVDTPKNADCTKLSNSLNGSLTQTQDLENFHSDYQFEFSLPDCTDGVSGKFTQERPVEIHISHQAEYNVTAPMEMVDLENSFHGPDISKKSKDNPSVHKNVTLIIESGDCLDSHTGFASMEKTGSSPRNVTFLVQENYNSEKIEFTTDLDVCGDFNGRSTETSESLQHESVVHIDECIPSNISPSIVPIVSENHDNTPKSIVFEMHTDSQEEKTFLRTKTDSHVSTDNSRETNIDLETQSTTTTNDYFEPVQISDKRRPPKKPPRKRKSNPKIGGLQTSFGRRLTNNVSHDDSYDIDEIIVEDENERKMAAYTSQSDHIGDGVITKDWNGKTESDEFVPDSSKHFMPIKDEGRNDNRGSSETISHSFEQDEALIIDDNVTVEEFHNENENDKSCNRENDTFHTTDDKAFPADDRTFPSRNGPSAFVAEPDTPCDNTEKFKEPQKKSVRLLGRFNSKDVDDLELEGGERDNVQKQVMFGNDLCLRNTEEELCASFLDFKDTWNSRKRNRQKYDHNPLSVKLFEPPWDSDLNGVHPKDFADTVDQNISPNKIHDSKHILETEPLRGSSGKENLRVSTGKDGTLLSDKNQDIGDTVVYQQYAPISGDVGDTTSASICSESSDEGEYVIEAPLETYGQGASWNPGIQTQSEYPIFDEKGEQIIAEVFTIGSEYSNETTPRNSNAEYQDLRESLRLNLDFLNKGNEDEFVDVTEDACPNSLLQVTDEMKNDSEVHTHLGDYNNTSTKPNRCVTFDVPYEVGKITHAYSTSGSDHVTNTFTGKTLINPQFKEGNGSATTNSDSVNDLDLKTNSCRDSQDSSKIAVIRDLSSGVEMPEKSSGSTKTSHMSEYKGGKKITTKTTTSVNDNGYSEDENTEQKRSLALLTEAISKLNGNNTDDIIPEINQSVTKLNGGNLIITTLTRKIVEEEDEQEKQAMETSAPEMGHNTYIVQDHKGDTYMIEDITDEYSSSERHYHTEYETGSQGAESPVYQRINNLRAHGRSGIDHDTAEEVLLSLYNPNGMEYTETDERSYSGTYSRDNMQVQPYGYSDSSSMTRTTAYEYEDEGSPYGSSSTKTVKQSYEMASMPQINPYFVQQPLIIPQLPVPQYNLLQLESVPQKVTTGVQVVTEQKEEPRIVTSTDETDSKQFKERPVYKSVALVKGPYETPKWHTAKKHKPYEPPDEVDSGRLYKVVKSSASDDAREETVSYEETTKTTTTMRAENAGFSGGNYFDENRNFSTIETGSDRPHKLSGHGVVNLKRTEERRPFRSTVAVNGGTGRKSYDQLDGYQSKLSTYLNHQQDYLGTPEPERKVYTDVDRDMRVVRGNILIKNNFEDGLDEFSDNINVFDNGFNMTKTNPLYNSDEDIYKRYEEEKRRQQQRDMRDMENMAFETVDRFSKSKNVTRKADGEHRKPRSKQNLTNLLLTRLSTMDSKDIRQTLDVKHHHEDVYGDPHLEQADGTSSRRITNSNYDTVTENVDLEMKDGKAFITITVTAERLTPIDYEFHVWRKNQAIVTRVVEIDFYADEQRRMLYDRVMDRVDDDGYSTNNKYSHYTRRKPQEVVLSSQDTLDLFNELMDAAGGEGDKEDITVKTKRNKTLLPENPFLY